MTKRTRPLAPLDPAFNDASNYIAAHIFPLGFDVCHGAPNTMMELSITLDRRQRMAIWSGTDERNTFADCETWRAFRAWHDYVHARYDCPFTMAGEHKAVLIQAGQLMRLYGRGDDVIRWIALMFSEIVGKLEARDAGNPPTNGHAFVARDHKARLPVAKYVAYHMGYTDVDAMRFADTIYAVREAEGHPATCPSGNCTLNHE